MTTLDPDRIALAVQTAWIDTLPDEVFSPTIAWADAGGDSIRALQLIMRLETALGRKISFDMLGPETSPSGLAALIAAGSPDPEDHLPLVHLIPGIAGDEPILANFRREFSGSIRFLVAELPGLDQSADLLIRFVATARWMAKRIMSAQPKGDLMVAGYSFGAGLAFEIAHQLTLRGRTVSFLCLLDPGTNQVHRPLKPSQPVAPPPLPPPSPLTARQRLLEAARLLLGRATRVSDIPAVPSSQATKAPRKKRQRRRYWKEQCLIDLRTLSSSHWKPEVQTLPALLVFTNDPIAEDSPTYRGEFLPKLEAVHVPSSHRRMFDSEPIATYRDIFADQISRYKDVSLENHDPRPQSPLTSRRNLQSRSA